MADATEGVIAAIAAAGGNVRKQFFAAVEGSKERDEGSPTSGAWGGPVERCLSGGGEMKAKGKRLLGRGGWRWRRGQSPRPTEIGTIRVG